MSFSVIDAAKGLLNCKLSLKCQGGLVIVSMLRRESIGEVARANGGTWGFALRVGYIGGAEDGFAKFGGRVPFTPGRMGAWASGWLLWGHGLRLSRMHRLENCRALRVATRGGMTFKD